jgi:hypothetical protein
MIVSICWYTIGLVILKTKPVRTMEMLILFFLSLLIGTYAALRVENLYKKPGRGNRGTSREAYGSWYRDFERKARHLHF